MTKQQVLTRIRKTNKHIKNLIKNKDYSKHPKEELEGMLTFGENKYKEVFNYKERFR